MIRRGHARIRALYELEDPEATGPVPQLDDVYRRHPEVARRVLLTQMAKRAGRPVPRFRRVPKGRKWPRDPN